MKAILRKRPNLKMLDESIKSILPFTNVLEIYKEFCTKDEFDTLSEGFKRWLECANDYNPVRFFVINGNIVMLADDMNGDFFGIYTLAHFFSENLKYYLIDKEEYELP